MEEVTNATFQQNFTCGKWNLTEKEENIQKVHGWWIQGLASIIMGCFGVVVNIIMIIVLSSKEFRKIFFNKLIITLTISDILFLIFNVYESLHLYFVKTTYCGLPGYIQFISYPSRKITMCFSIYMTVILTFERFSAVTNPITHRNRTLGASLTKQLMKYISPVFLVSFVIFGAPLFFAFKMEEMTLNGNNILINSTNLSSEKSFEVSTTLEPAAKTTMYCMTIWLRTDHLYILLYNNLTNFLITGAIPFLLLVCFNCKIYQAIRESLRTRQELNIRQPSHRSGSSIDVQDKGRDILQSLVLFGIVISFFVCHVLRVVLNMEEIIYFEEINQRRLMEEKLKVTCTGVQFWTMIAGDLSHFLLQVNSSINFFIYGYISSQFKKALREKIFNCKFLRRPVSTSNQSNEEETRNGVTMHLTEIITEGENT